MNEKRRIRRFAPVYIIRIYIAATLEAEHWDTIEKIAPRSEWKNNNGKFYRTVLAIRNHS